MVGCGAVGQVFGLTLQKAGVELGFYARPASAHHLKQALQQDGLALYQTSHFRRNNPIVHRLTNYQVLIDITACQQFQPDQIWFTTPSPVYYSEWFRDFLVAVSSKRVVCFAPEGGRPEFFPEGVAQDRLVFGGITLISWQGGTDAGGGSAGGINFWLPPFSTIPLVGTPTGCYEVAAVLKGGGLRAMIQKKELQKSQAAVTGLMSAFVVGYQLSGWSFKTYQRSPWLTRAARGAREAASSQLLGTGILTNALFRMTTTRAVFHMVTLVLPWVMPFDIEKYLRFHYQKTRDQSLMLLELFINDGERLGLEVGNIRSLLQGLEEAGEKKHHQNSLNLDR